ncbi:3-hydroxyisobutyrate dehydrogenase [Rickenella mellea]|uniref:3-hydroxyisobutyrate dehydrogenase n=1 Tax=Rickenella mellea TaxID=50990 RepID=A0A4Y7QHW8_9AGAM|nr:3-hydroxyisobutyrate dehydrogenase [Rickenella mellea]
MRVTPPIFNQLARHVTRPKSISFIGLGRMGSEMAFNLFSKTFAESKDAQFTVCDAVPEAAHAFRRNFQEHFPGASLHVSNTPEEAAIKSQTIITMLPSSPQVRSVYSEDRGIISALRHLSREDANATLCIDSTTLHVAVARAVSEEVHKLGALMVDAPVSGGVTGAKAGTLSFLVGGTHDEFTRASPTLALMGQRIIHCGHSGSGLAAKICNNLVLGVEQIVVAEAMLLGQKLGLNPAVLAGVINNSTGGCWSSSVNNPVPSALPDKSPPCERDYEGGFATALMLKDMGLATDSANAAGTPLPLGQMAQNIYEKVIREKPDLARKDFSSVYQYLETQLPGHE